MNHPGHLYDRDNVVGLPSALIPFCAYGTDMEAVGKMSINFSFPVCNSFKPTLLKGRVCYKLELDWRLERKQGVMGGLTLMIDRNRERHIDITESKKSEKKKKRIKLIERADDDSAEVYLPTLAPHTFSRPGKYPLSALKKMTGTERFSDLPTEIRDCHKGNTDSCENAKLIEASQKECGCLPWTLKDVTQQKVRYEKSVFNPENNFYGTVGSYILQFIIQ